MKKQRFNWQAVDEQGIFRHGTRVDDEIPGVQVYLRQKGYFPVKVQAVRDWRSIFPGIRTGFEWSYSARRLAVLLEAGIPLLQALDILSFSEKRLTFEQEQWQRVKESVEAGSDLSEALALLKPAPNNFFISMIKAGEYTGSLGKVLNEVADELELEHSYHKKVKSALAYPLFLLLAVVVVLYILSVWVLPMYEKLFTNMEAELPFLTKVIFAGGRLIPLILWSIPVLSLGSFMILKYGISERRKKSLEHLFSRIPLFGKVYRLRDLVQFCQILTRLIEAGIPLLEALHLTAGTLRSQGMVELTNQLALNVRQGKRMAPLLRASRIFPLEGAEMILVAEESGQLDTMLRNVTQLFRRELEDQLDRLTRLLEPALILVLAGIIGFVASGVMLPIFDLSSHLE